ncbi:TPA: hypothetical protein JG871_003951 [Enterobacter hormaechei subsp. xiangfangensis]|nr:hypothetical protein [Enterobacter hormaechei subsp. xiangfangensis]
MVKRRTERADAADVVGKAEQLANRLADRVYGEEKPAPVEEETLSRTTISLPTSLLREIEDLATENKRAKKDPRNVSALVREALVAYLHK